jgi:hypothetical protein
MKPDTKRKPIFGVASIIAPLLGVLVGLAIIQLHPRNTADFGGLGTAVLFIYATFILGVISSIVGFVRHERMAYLLLLGFVVNTLPILAALAQEFRR